MPAPSFLRKATNNIVADMTKVVDPSWRIVGQAPDGRPVYESNEVRWKNVPDIDPDTKLQRTATNPINGLPTYRMRRLETWTEPFQFVLVDPGNGNVRREAYHEPTPEELRERDMNRRKHGLMADLIHGLAERNVSVDDLLNAIAPATPAETISPEPDPEYPQGYAPGRWRLSNGTTMQGSKADAQAAEDALHN